MDCTYAAFFLILTLFPFFKSDINFDFFLNLIIHFYFESCSLLCVFRIFIEFICCMHSLNYLFNCLFVCLFVYLLCLLINSNILHDVMSISISTYDYFSHPILQASISSKLTSPLYLLFFFLFCNWLYR